jgi:hypothetical protein
METHTKNAKLPPEAYGCLEPFTLTSCAGLNTDENTKESITRFINAYSETGKQLGTYFMGLLSGTPDQQITATLLINPNQMNPEVKKSKLAEAANTWAEKETGKTFAEFVEGHTYHILRDLNFESPRNRDLNKQIKSLLKSVPLDFGNLSPERFTAIFGTSPNHTWCAKLADQVTGTFRAFLASKENTREKNEEKQKIIQEMIQKAPVFASLLTKFLYQQAAWISACRILTDIRKELRDKGIKHETLTACQKTAMQQCTCKEIAEHTFPTAEEIKEATGHETLTNQLATHLSERTDAGNTTKESWLFTIRRLSSKNRLKAIAREPFLAHRLIEMYETQFGRLPAKEREECFVIKNFGRKNIATGWEKMLQSRGTSATAKMAGFFKTELTDFAASHRTHQTPAMDIQRTPFWPMMSEGQDWYSIPEDPKQGNALKIEIRIPAFHTEPQQTARATIRGNTNFTQAAKLAQPLNIKNGLFQFRPNLESPVKMDATRKTYTKVQALRLMTDPQGRIQTAISTTRMVQTPLPAIKRDTNKKPVIRPKERLAIIHLNPGAKPGNMRIATINAFKFEGQWNLIKLKDDVPQTHSGAYALINNKKARYHNRGTKEHSYWHIQANPLAKELDALKKTEEKSKSIPPVPAPNPGTANTNTTNPDTRKTPDSTYINMGKTFLRQQAHNVQRILARNHINHVIIAGKLPTFTTRENHPLGLHNFFHLNGGPSGYLAMAIKKAGASITITSAQGARCNARPFRQTMEYTPKTKIEVGTPFRTTDEKESKESGISFQGTPEHIYFPESKSTSPFQLNAAWSILLSYLCPEYLAAAKKALETTNGTLPAKNEIINSKHPHSETNQTGPNTRKPTQTTTQYNNYNNNQPSSSTTNLQTRLITITESNRDCLNKPCQSLPDSFTLNQHSNSQQRHCCPKI